jgi:hypothetical protein
MLLNAKETALILRIKVERPVTHRYKDPEWVDLGIEASKLSMKIDKKIGSG